MTDLSTAQWSVIAVVSVLGGFVTGAGGFGFGLVTTPILLWFLPAPMVVVMNLATSVALRIPLLWVDRLHVSLRHAAPMALGGVVGMPLGLLVLAHFTAGQIRIWAGTVVIAMSIAQLVGSDRLPPLRPLRGVTALSVGTASGALNTSISLSGPPMVLWLLNQRVNGRPFRGTISAASLFLNGGGVILLVHAGFAELSWLSILVVACPAAAAGTYLGHAVLSRISAQAFSRLAAAAVVVVSGLTVLFSLGEP